MAYRSLLGSTLLFAMWFGTAPSLSAQTPPQSSQEPISSGITLKAESRVVVVDVVVVDDHGKTIPGLSRSDFQVLEEGAPQIVSGFEEHKGAASTELKLPPMPANVFTNFPTTRSTDSVNILLLDLLNTQPQDHAVLRKAINKFLENIPPGTRMAVFVLGKDLRIVRGFTADFSGLSAALDDKRLALTADMREMLPTDSEENAEIKAPISQMRMSNASPIAIEAMQQAHIDRRAQLNMSRAEMTLQALQHIARYLSGIPTRKNVIWLSDTFPVSLFPDSNARTLVNRDDVKKTSDVLTAAQVAIYPVSALGIAGDPTFDVSEIAGTRQELIDRVSANQIAMETIARETGGRAFYNTNALSDAVQDAVGSGSRYYTLSYAPANAKLDGKFRKIEVKVSKPGAALSYRHGYYADKPDAARYESHSEDDPLIPLIGFGMPNFDQILYKVAVSKKQPQPSSNAPRAGTNTELKPPLFRYNADFGVSLQDLNLLSDSHGVRHGEIEIMMIAFDTDGRILNIVRKKSKVSMNSEVYSATLPVGMQIHEEIDVPVGDVYLKLGLYDPNSGKCGTVGIPLARLAEGQSSLK